MRRFVQSIVLLGLCVVLAAALDGFYVVAAIGAALIALCSGVAFMMAIALGAIWPVLGLSYVVYTVNNASRTQALHRSVPAPRPRESRLTGVEDPQHREN